MYVCCMYVFVCMYVCLYVCMFVFVCMYVCMYAYLNYLETLTKEYSRINYEYIFLLFVKNISN